MLFTITSLVVLAVGIILIVLSKNRKLRYWTRENLEFTGLLFMVLGALVSLVCVGCIIGNASTRDIAYQNALHERDVLEYRIEHMEENITGNEMLYNDIVEFNNNLRSTKRWADSLWLNWFYNQDIAAMDFIEIGD
jgi:hypothetical protein